MKPLIRMAPTIHELQAIRLKFHVPAAILKKGLQNIIMTALAESDPQLQRNVKKILREFLIEHIIGCNKKGHIMNINPRKSALYVALILLVSIFVLSCGKTEKEFQAAKETNTIEAYNAFIEKYPDTPFAVQAIDLRDQLAYEKAIETHPIDSLAILDSSAVKNLQLNAEHAVIVADSSKEYVPAIENYVLAGDIYSLQGEMKDIVGDNSSEMYKLAAYYYYRASRKSQAAELEAVRQSFIRHLSGNYFSAEVMQYEAAAAMAPHHFQKSLLYDKSAE